MDPNEHEKASLPTPQPWLEGLNRAILDSALDCIIVMNARGRVVEFNAAAERVFGYTRKQAVGQELADLIIPPALRDFEHVKKALRADALDIVIADLTPNAFQRQAPGVRIVCMGFGD